MISNSVDTDDVRYSYEIETFFLFRFLFLKDECKMPVQYSFFFEEMQKEGKEKEKNAKQSIWISVDFFFA